MKIIIGASVSDCSGCENGLTKLFPVVYNLQKTAIAFYMSTNILTYLVNRPVVGKGVC